jgi:hypothetical protein
MDNDGLRPKPPHSDSTYVKPFTDNGYTYAASLMTHPNSEAGRYFYSSYIEGARVEKMTPEEKKALKLYTTVAYKNINGFLRKSNSESENKGLRKMLKSRGFVNDKIFKKESLEDAFSNYNAQLDAARRKHPIDYGSVLLRGMGFDFSGGDSFEKDYTTPGKIVTEYGYMSASVGRPFLNTHLMMLETSPDVDGRWIAPSSETPKEDEVLFPPNTSLIIKEVVEANAFPGADIIGKTLRDYHLSQNVLNNPEFKDLENDYQYIKKYIFAKAMPREAAH